VHLLHFVLCCVLQFSPRPWDLYADVPQAVATYVMPKDDVRLYLDTPFDSFWYLGERLAWQTRYPRPVVPVPPPRVLFEQTHDRNVRMAAYHEGQSDTLLLRDQDYQSWAWRYLACGPIEVCCCSLFLWFDFVVCFCGWVHFAKNVPVFCRRMTLTCSDFL
jgi:hypothetical protein